MTRVTFRFIVLIIVVAGVLSHGVCVVVVRPNSVFAVRVTVRDLVARSRRTFSGALGHGEACRLPPATCRGVMPRECSAPAGPQFLHNFKCCTICTICILAISA